MERRTLCTALPASSAHTGSSEVSVEGAGLREPKKVTIVSRGALPLNLHEAVNIFFGGLVVKKRRWGPVLVELLRSD